MCDCQKPTRNDEPGFSYGAKDREPALIDGDTLLYDEPGRCAPSVNGEKGKTDYHSHHYRIVRDVCGGTALLVRHGMGDERLDLGGAYTKAAQLFDALPTSDARFLLASMLFSVRDEAANEARKSEANKWRAAIADGRARKRRYPRRGTTRVWIEEGPRVFDVSA
jgi:hypothetical protein